MAQSSCSAGGLQANRWKWFLAFGALMLILSLAGVGVSAVMELTSVVLFGPMLLAAAVVQALAAFFTVKKEALLHLAASALEALLGLWIMAHPLENVVDLMTLVGVFLLVVGVIRLARSLITAAPDRGFWTASAGMVALFLGVCLWLRWPEAKWWFVGLCIAVDFLARGIGWSVLAFVHKKDFPTPAAN